MKTKICLLVSWLLLVFNVVVLSLLLWQNIGVTSIENCHYWAVEKLTASNPKLCVVSTVMVHLCFSEHGKIFNFRFTKWRTIWGNEDHFWLSSSERFQSLLVSENSLSWFHHKLDARVHGLDGFLLLTKRIQTNWVRHKKKKGNYLVVVVRNTLHSSRPTILHERSDSLPWHVLIS